MYKNEIRAEVNIIYLQIIKTMSNNNIFWHELPCGLQLTHQLIYIVIKKSPMLKPMLVNKDASQSEAIVRKSLLTNMDLNMDFI